MIENSFLLRSPRPDDYPLFRGVVFHQCLTSGYWHGVGRSTIHKAAEDIVGAILRLPDWTVEVAVPVDPELIDEICGFAMRKGAKTWAFAYVKPDYRERGCFKKLVQSSGLKEGDNVEVILASPNAVRIARAKYKVFFTPFQILEIEKQAVKEITP